MDQQVKEIVAKRIGRIQETFNHLHAHPEISWLEVKTTQYLADRMQKLGLTVTTFDDSTGLVAQWGEGKPVIGLRTDIDALWQEVDGEWRANHSCGHDAHMTMIVETVEALKESGFTPRGTLKILFQPAEEKGDGALKLIEKGVVDDVDYLFGVHLRPIQEMKTGFAGPAIYNGAAMSINGEIKGVAAHGARPHLGINVIEVAGAIISGLSTIHINPVIPATVKMTKLHAGGDSTNIIPDHAHFSLDLRTQANEEMDELIAKTEQVLRAVGTMFGATIEWTNESRMVAAVVNDEAKQLMEEAIISAIGAKQLLPAPITPGAEDFHFYTVERPNIKATMLALGCDLKPGLHHPKMEFDHSALPQGVEILAHAIIRTFQQATS